MIVNIITLFPEVFPGTLGVSIICKAIEKNSVKLNIIDLRKYGLGANQQVDDSPYGGGEGMVIRADILGDAIDDILQKYPDTQLIYTSPAGDLFKQSEAENLSHQENLTFICGRFEGIDQRIIDYYDIKVINLGDFILCGGEVAVLAILEATIRLIPGVTGNHSSVVNESFSNKGENSGLLEYPMYTRPQIWNNVAVPDILLSGNHKKIKDWRQNQAHLITKKKRPDLLK